MEKFTGNFSPELFDKINDLIDSDSLNNNDKILLCELQDYLKGLKDTNRNIAEKNTSLNQTIAAFYKDRYYYKEVFNSLPAGLYRIRVFAIDRWANKSWASSDNPPYIVELASDRFCEILGVTRDVFSKNPYIISDLVHPHDKDSFVEKNTIANKLFVPFKWEGRLVVKNKIIWVNIESLPQLLENGESLWTGTISVTTERKLAESKLNEARMKLEDVLEGANIGTLEWNIQTGKIRFNDIWAANLGYNKFEIKMGLIFYGRNGWKKITHPDDITYAEEMLQRHYSGELPFHNVEVRMLHKKGHWVWIRQAGKVKTWTKEGKPLMMYGTHVDISAQKKAEQALFELNNELEERIEQRTYELTKLNESLRQTEMKFMTVSDFTYDWEYWRSPKNEILFMSPSVVRVTGYTVDEFEKDDKLIDKIIHPSDLHIWNNHKHERFGRNPHENKIEISFRIITKTGETKWLGHVCRSVIIDGEYLGVRVSNRDITDTVNAENKLPGITVEVEERERNRFSRELHDGMGPLLSTIKLYFQWLSDTTDVDKRKLITEKGNHSIEMAIQTARELARGLSSQFVNKLGYVNAIADFIQRINDTDKIHIQFNPETTERFSSLYELMLFRITTELIKNTLTYAQASKIIINFDYNKANKTILFYYEDNGIGFDELKIQNSTSGLGLQNIKYRVKIMKGDFVIKSKPNQGMYAQIEFTVDDEIGN